MSRVGEKVAGYVMLRRLAQGRKGETWLAERHVGGHQAAIKLVRWPAARRPDSEANTERLFRERLDAVRALQHPSTARVLGGGRDGEHAYVISEFVLGVDLALVLERAHRDGPWPSISLALHVMRHISAALAEAHRAGVVHGRLSPSRVLIASTGEVKLVGFVSAPTLHEELDTVGHSAAQLDLAYLSPEHAHDLEAKDKRSDVFSLGALLCELVTKTAPFRRQTDLETLAAITEAQTPTLPPELDPRLAEIIKRALARKPDDRFADADAFLAAVDSVEVPPVDEDELTRISQLSRAQGTAAPWEVGEPIEDTLASEPSKRRFDILQRIGEGGMGEVYRARDRELDEVVALKVISRDLAEDAQLLDRMRREVRLARRISSDRVCRIHDLVELEDGARGISMQFVEGQTLAQLIKSGVPVDYARFAAWGADVADGLAAAHSLSVVHRDLKPENVMIDGRDRAVILDFGIAASSDPETADKLTKQGVILGTLPYMAPEQLTAAPVDGRADIYALGLILGELITGEVPFSAPDYAGLLDKRVVHPSRYDLRSIDPAAPKDLSEAVGRMLMSPAAERPADASEIARVLRRVAHEAKTGPEYEAALEHPTPVPEHETESSRPSTTQILEEKAPQPESSRGADELPTEPPRSPVWSVLALGVAVVLLGVGLVVLGQVLERGPEDEEKAASPLVRPGPNPAPPTDAGAPEDDAGTTEVPDKTRKKDKNWLPPVERM